ncbi:MAG TPA: MobF family relaxase [Acidimicrobiales bacterium]|nr:MobF family relaxase [Acidimicrobiales bacterium]
MTVRVQTLKGADAGAYYVEHLPSYYLDAGEPPGRWHGKGAELLDLAGEVDDEAFLALMAGLHPETGNHLGRRYGDHAARGFDMTASAPKSVSVLFALGDGATRQAVLESHDAAVAALVDWVEAHAHTRYRERGEIGVFDAEGIVAATFRQHTSRTLDSQLHTHVVIANRVRSNDGRWLALDARLIKHDQRTLSALYHATLRAELRRRLGVEWNEPTNAIAEIATVHPDVLAEFSTRTGQVEARFEEKLERFEAAFGRQPTQRERWRLDREAVTDSRPAKVHGFDAEELHEQWADQARAIGYEPERVVAAALNAELESHPIDHISRTEVAAAALAALAEGQSTWRAAEVVRELAAAVPPSVTEEPGRLVAWLDELAAEVIAAHMVELSPAGARGMELRRDGRPVSESVLHRALSTPAIVAQEEALVLWADKRIEAGGVDAVSAARRTTLDLSGPQREVAAAVAGTRELVLVVGPAGTGKTTALAPAVAQLRAEGRAVFGVAPSATAAEVLSAETGVGADTIDKLLIEHRLARAPQPEFFPPAPPWWSMNRPWCPRPSWPSWPTSLIGGAGGWCWWEIPSSSPPWGARACSATSRTASAPSSWIVCGASPIPGSEKPAWACAEATPRCSGPTTTMVACTPASGQPWPPPWSRRGGRRGAGARTWP